MMLFNAWPSFLIVSFPSFFFLIRENHSKRPSHFTEWLFLSLTFKSVILYYLQIYIDQIWSLPRFLTSFLPEFTMCLACDYFLGSKLSNQILHNLIYSPLHFTKWIISFLTFHKMNIFHHLHFTKWNFSVPYWSYSFF